MSGGKGSWVREYALYMVDDHNPDYTESKPLNTELETITPEATAEHADLSNEFTPTTHQTVQPQTPEAATADVVAEPIQTPVIQAAAETDLSQASEEPDYDAADF